MTEVCRVLAICVLLALIGTACGGDDTPGTDATSVSGTDATSVGDDSPTTAGSSGSADSDDAIPAGDGVAGGADAAAGDTASGVVGSGSATIALANGESFEFSILCALEPQQAAGSEILFSLVSYDEPAGLDVTQFGDDSFDGAANITIYDSSTYATLWEAVSLDGTGLTLERDGTTITGTGMFYVDGDIGGEAVGGELDASC